MIGWENTWAYEAPRRGALLVDQLALQGYQPGTTGAQVVLCALGCPIDEDLAKIYRCHCGHLGMELRPFTRGQSYRAFAVCPTCDAAYEF